MSEPSILTIDVEEWFHGHNYLEHVAPREWEGMERSARDGVERLLDLCDELDMKATWFLLGWQVEKEPAIAKRIAERGHEIGCHTYAHPVIYELDPEDFRRDTVRARNVIADAVGYAPILYRAASFTITQRSYWALSILAEEGFRIDSSVFPVFHPRYGNPGGPRAPFRLDHADGLLVIPMTTLRLPGLNLPFSGGGYFRLLPVFAQKLCGRIVRERQHEPIVHYFHPWELEDRVPDVKLGGLQQLRSQGGKRDLHEKLKSVLRGRPTTTLGAWAAGIRADAPVRSLS